MLIDDARYLSATGSFPGVDLMPPFKDSEDELMYPYWTMGWGLGTAVRRSHGRKYSFMPAFERVVEGRSKQREPSFLERARRRWPRRGGR